MLKLFSELKGENNIWDAQLVGKNLFCKHPDNIDVFCQYFDFCINISTYPIEYDTRSFFAKEAELVLGIFCEHVEINPDILEVIKQRRNNLYESTSKLNVIIENKNLEYVQSVEVRNRLLLTNLAKIKGKLSNVKTQETFDKCLDEVAMCECDLVKEQFTKEQQDVYNSLTKEYSLLVSEKMSELAHKEDVEYNKKAVKDFRTAFEKFKKSTDEYKSHDSHLYELVSKYLFAYDAKRLFNESLVYYNHVYSYIFNKLDDDGKFRFTQLSFDIAKASK